MKGKWMYVAAAGMREGPGASFNGWVASRRWEMVGLFSGYSPSIHSIPFFLFLSSSSCNPPLHTHAHRYKAALSVTFLFPLPSSSSSTTDRHVLRRHRPGLEERRRLIKRDHSRKKTKKQYPSFFIHLAPSFLHYISSLLFIFVLHRFITSFHFSCPASRDPSVPLCFIVVLALEPAFFFLSFPLSTFCTV